MRLSEVFSRLLCLWTVTGLVYMTKAKDESLEESMGLAVMMRVPTRLWTVLKLFLRQF